MKFEEIGLLLEKRSYKHREDYHGNEKGSYINKGKTYWDYSGDATPGNERIVSQIQNKISHKFDSYASRSEIKKYLKSDKAQKIYDKLSSIASEKFGEDENDKRWRSFVYGGLTTSVARALSKGKNKGLKDLL